MNSRRRILILGSTGSIGKNALFVCSNDSQTEYNFEIVGLGCFSDSTSIIKQAYEHEVKHIAVINPKKPISSDVTTYTGSGAFIDLINETKPNIVLNAVSGCAGLKYTKFAIENGIDVALANKESLVMGGSLILDLAKEKGAKLIPVDSEHSAIYQLVNEKLEFKNIKNICITGSGGPFLNRNGDTFKDITVEEALKHPNWSMGRKITIDSATLMNKGLEVIEAFYLFGIRKDQIRVVIHPESIIHGMVEMIDGTLFSQMAVPDMKGPIAYALFGEKRKAGLMDSVDLLKISKFNFADPDTNRFPLLKLTYDIIGDEVKTIVLNSANEVAVHKFLDGKIKFNDIFKVVDECVKKFGNEKISSFDEIFSLDEQVRLSLEPL
jgi:1-deoxy-D-xylulose-5-phosphate reductoisomerase